MTMNSPESLLELYRLASKPEHQTGDGHNHPLLVAELMREAGLKCIGLNGVSALNCCKLHQYIS
jgi:hypothetical protein